MKKQIFGMLVVLGLMLANTAHAAPVLVEDKAKAREYVKAIIEHLKGQKTGVCYDLILRGNYTQGGEIGMARFVDALSPAESTKLYIDQSGDQPAIEVVTKPKFGEGKYTTSVVTDRSFRNILSVEHKITEEQELNMGTLLNPDFQLRPVVMYLVRCHYF